MRIRFSHLPRKILPLLGLMWVSFSGVVEATTRYISPSGSDSNTGTSQAAPVKTFNKAFSLMSAGDELVLLDGTYSSGSGTGYMNWDDGSCSACGQPPSGTVAALTVVRALNPGSVTVNGGAREGLFMGRSSRKDSYIKIQGITFEGGGALYNTYANIIKDCGFHKTAQDGGDVFGIGTNDGNWGNAKNLIEDVWIWGKNRIIADNYRADRTVWRRVVLRGDGCNTVDCTGSGNPNVGFTVYNSSNVSVQNVMVVDRILGGGEPYGDFASAQHAAGGVDMGPGEYLGPNEWLGTISLKSPDGGYTFEGDDVNSNTAKLANVVAWDSGGGGINIGARFNNTNLQNVTVGFTADDGVRLDPGVTGGGTIRNLIVTNATRYGINSAVQPSYSDVYNTAGSDYNQTSCATGCRTTNPQGDGTPASIKYVARVEAGAALSGSGFGGADYGANVIKRYGADGAAYGDANYNTLTATNLWPWPNEARIKSELCAGETRGFCSASSLTQYVWNYLGNGNPYSGGGDTTPPAVSISSPTAGATVSGTFAISGAASDNVGVTLVEFFVNGVLQGTDSTAPYSISWNTTLLGNGSYSLTAKAYDAAGNNATSSAVSVTVNNPDIVPPVISNVGITNLLPTSVTIEWTTDENATSQVDYGVTAAYGFSTPLDSSLVTTHSESLAALLPLTLYHYRVKSRDAAGNLAPSGDFTFTTPSVPDTTPPTTSITSPTTGPTVSGTVTISGTAADNVGVTRVDFYLDGVLQGSDTTAPYSLNWNTLLVTEGAHVLKTRARDAAGNSADSANVTVTVNNVDGTSPIVAITSPSNGDIVNGTVQVSAAASDNIGVTRVDFYVDGAFSKSVTALPYRFNWLTTAVSNGAHELTAKAFDAAANQKTSAVVAVSVQNNVFSGQNNSVQQNVCRPLQNQPCVFLIGEGSLVNILDVHGASLRSVPVIAGVAQWDSRNSEGNLVASGRYMAVGSHDRVSLVVIK